MRVLDLDEMSWVAGGNDDQVCVPVKAGCGKSHRRHGWGKCGGKSGGKRGDACSPAPVCEPCKPPVTPPGLPTE